KIFEPQASEHVDGTQAEARQPSFDQGDNAQIGKPRAWPRHVGLCLFSSMKTRRSCLMHSFDEDPIFLEPLNRDGRRLSGGLFDRTGISIIHVLPARNGGNPLNRTGAERRRKGSEPCKT